MGSIPGRLWRRFKYIVWDSDSSGWELAQSVLYLMWAYLLLYVTPGILTNSPAFAAMAVRFTQEQWAVGFIATGLIKLAGVMMKDVLYPGRRSEGATRAVRALGAFMGLLIWAYTTTGIYLSVGLNTGVVVYGLMGVICFLTLLRHARPVKFGAGHAQ